MKPGKWSGLAPAVDAHIARWSYADRGAKLMEAAIDGLHHRKTDPIRRALHGSEWIHMWAQFGLSYGLPDKDGIPMASVVIRDEEDSSNGDMTIVAPGFQGGAPKAMTGKVVGIHADTEVLEGATILGREQFQGTEAAVLQGLSLADRELRMLRNATTHYVSAEVMDEVTEAAGLIGPEPLHGTDLFCPSGLAVFETPLVVPDLDPDTGVLSDEIVVWIRAIGWHVHGGIGSIKTGTIRDGVSLFLYTTGQDFIDGYVTTLALSGRAPGFDPQAASPGLLPTEVIPWAFGAEWGVRDTTAHIPGTVPSPVGYQRRWFLTFMRMMWQEVIVHHRGNVKRPEARRWEHELKGKRPKLDYTVLRLRRMVDPLGAHDETGMGHALDHRVLVRGHWRRQWVGSLGPARLPDGTMDPLTHRLVWIEPHFRGPEDGPMGPLHHATSFVR